MAAFVALGHGPYSAQTEKLKGSTFHPSNTVNFLKLFIEHKDI